MILDGSGRFVLHDKPAAFPFSDIVTGTSEGPVFDLSVDLEFYSGVAYIKAEHVKEMAKTLGMLTKEEADELRATFAKQELPAHVERFINGIDTSLVEYRNAISTVPIVAPVYLLDPHEEAEGNGTREPDSSVKSDEGSDKSAEQLSRIVSDDSGKLEAGGPSKATGEDSKPSVNKGPAKLSAGSNDGFNF